MSCIDLINIKEAENTALAGGENFNTLMPNQTADYTRGLYEMTAHYGKLVEEGEDSWYEVFGVKIPKRVSNLASYAYQRRVGRARMERMRKFPDNTIRTTTGTNIHAVMEDYLNYYASGIGSISAIRKNSVENIPGLTNYMSKKLEKQARDLYKQFKTMQNDIDPNGKFTVHTEQMAVDPVRGMGGTMDVHVIFSDNTDALIDYKSVSLYASHLNNSGTEIVSEVVKDSKQSDWNLTVGEYRRINQELYGIKKTRMSRVVLVGIQYEAKEGKNPPGSRLSGNIRRLYTEADSEYLDPRPIFEEARYAGINRHLSKQTSLIQEWEERLRTGKLPAHEKAALNVRIANLRKAANKLILKAQTDDTFQSIKDTLKLANKKLKQPTHLKNGDLNPEYPTPEELINIRSELNLYTNLIAEFNDYFADLKKVSPKDFKIAHAAFIELSSKVLISFEVVKDRLQDTVKDSIPEYALDDKGNLLTQNELNYADRTFNRMSEIDHPIFEAAWTHIQDAQYDTRQSIKILHEEVSKVNDGVRHWAKRNGVNTQQAFFKIIDREAGALIPRYDKEFREKINDAKSTGDIKFLQDVFEFKDKTAYKKKYIEKKKSVSMFLTAKQLRNWEKRHDLLNSNDAWYNVNLYEDLKYKEDVAVANYSAQYKELLNSSNKELLDFYTVYEEQNRKLRDLTGLSYGDMPDDFIPNIRKEIIEIMVEDGLFNMKPGAISQEWRDSLNIREEDAHIASVDANGQFKRNIPLLYLNKIRSKNGEVENNRKSYDLAHSLMVFGNMAYTYVNMKKIEPTLLGLRSLLAEPTAKEGGTFAQDLTGRKVRGKFVKFVEQAKPSGDTTRFFEDVTDFYLYGIRFKVSSLSKSFDTTKALLKLKDYYAKKTLAFAVIPAGGAYVAGKIATALEATKNKSFSRKDSKKSYILLATDYEKYSKLPEFFDTFAEEHIEKYSTTLSASRAKKFTDTRTLFSPLRLVDESITAHVTVAMAQNWGIDEAGNLIRLNRIGINTDGIKSIWDTFKKEGDKFVLENTNKDVEIQFRSAVRKTVANIIGSLAQDDISGVSTSLLLNLAMQFKSWMPGIVRERLGKLRYDKDLQSFQWGRFKALGNELLGKEDTKTVFELQAYLNGYVAKRLSTLTLDLITFGLSHKAGIGRVNREKNKKYYYQWLLNNPQVSNRPDSEELFEEYLATKEGQIKAALTEARVLAIFGMLITYLGGNADGEEPRYMENYVTRLLFKLLFKTQSEISFVWNPSEFTRMISKPFPLASILSDFARTMANTFDETRDLLFGEDSNRDKAPPFYYTIQWVIGAKQLSRIVELFEQQKKPVGY